MGIAIGTWVVKVNDPGKGFASLRSKLWSFFSIFGTQLQIVHCFRVEKILYTTKNVLSDLRYKTSLIQRR